jgi:hypothetical protein
MSLGSRRVIVCLGHMRALFEPLGVPPVLEIGLLPVARR